MGLFDIFKKNKKRTLYDEMIDIPGFKEYKELYNNMSELNKNGCSIDEMLEGIGEFGPVNTIQGSILYLGGLRSTDGNRVNNKRLRSVAVKNISKPIDEYLITNQNGDDLAIIYISPYQAVNSKKAPRGFMQVSPLL